MKKKSKVTLLSLIDEQIKLWQPSKKLQKENPKQAAKDKKEADEIAEKLYLTHSVVGERDTYKIFGYGSLLNERSRSRTMTPISVTYDKVRGYRRIFNLLITQGTCLNVEPENSAIIDGAVCEIDVNDMMNFILREFNYDVLKVKTVKGEDVFMVMASKDKGHNVAGPEQPEYLKSDTHVSWQDVMPRVDYIQACYHGVYNLIGEANIFLSNDTVLFDGEPLIDFIEELSPTVDEVQPKGDVKTVNKLIEYWKNIDSAY